MRPQDDLCCWHALAKRSGIGPCSELLCHARKEVKASGTPQR
jgi:hypothetical protein